MTALSLWVIFVPHNHNHKRERTILMTSPLYYIGIDGGGTKCRIILEDENGKLITSGLSGPANIMRDCDTAITSIIEAIDVAIENTGIKIPLSQCIVGAGLAGANVSIAAQQFNQWQHPFKFLTLMSDLHAACYGAHDGKDGAVIITGTGSSATCYLDDSFKDFGGHGFPIGDTASGAWLGLRAIEHTLHVLDGLKPKDVVSEAVLKHLNADSTMQIVTLCASYKPADFASIVSSLIPLLHINEPFTVSLFQEGTHYIEQVASKLLSNHTVSLALIGGLSEIYYAQLPKDIKSRVVTSKHSPEKGALLYAKQQFVAEEVSL